MILDWGCGNARAASEFAKKYGEKAKVYGYSKDSYKEWEKIDNVKIIQETKEDLFRYLKPNSVDLIYSYLGLRHVPGVLTGGKKGREYLDALLEKVSPGGKIVFSAPFAFFTAPRLKKHFEGRAKIDWHYSLHEGSVHITKTE